MSEELKTCPCCEGRSAVFLYNSYFVECKKCGLKTRHYVLEQEAVEMWNKRAPIEIDREKLAEALYCIIYDSNEVVSDLIFKIRMKDLRADADRIIKMMKGY